MKIITLSLLSIQPSQLYICKEKLDAVAKKYADDLNSVPAISVRELNNELIFTDGHTRALFLYLHNRTEITVYYDTDELDWNAYETCVQWCKQEKIFSIADLQNRYLSFEEYEIKWIQQCRDLN